MGVRGGRSYDIAIDFGLTTIGLRTDHITADEAQCGSPTIFAIVTRTTKEQKSVEAVKRVKWRFTNINIYIYIFAIYTCV